MRLGQRSAVVTVCVLALLQVAGAITVVPVEVICPVCGTKNQFGEYASWGGYVYEWPSKYQMVFWPQTSSTSWYICRHCHLALLMWDFRELPKEKVESVRGVLKGLKVEDVPMSTRLEIAEKVYRVLDKDDTFWAQFYRVAGYHLAQEGKPTEAAEARKHALQYIQKLLDENAQPGHRKELLLTAAAMKHFLNDDAAAQADLVASAAITFTDPKMEAAQVKNFDLYLSRLIADYRQKLKSQSVPADLADEQESEK